jgi:hypothetical protein
LGGRVCFAFGGIFAPELPPALSTTVEEGNVAHKYGVDFCKRVVNGNASLELLCPNEIFSFSEGEAKRPYRLIRSISQDWNFISPTTAVQPSQAEPPTTEPWRYSSIPTGIVAAIAAANIISGALKLSPS